MLFKINYFKNKVIMKTTNDFKRFLSELTLWVFMVTTINPVPALATVSSDKVIYPLKQISKLECRFNEFADLAENCKQDLLILNTKDYKKYATKDWGYNDYTRLYTMLWWASYKYGWDVWNGGHIWTDIATSKWTPVYSMADWTVLKAKTDTALWNYISIEHKIKGKTVVSNYAHLSKLWVNAGDKVSVWDKIWEVWSTWNSTWNHLHFQIDLSSASHPYYYDYSKCPYSYYNITENGLCIEELGKNTIDPLLFLETSWAILDSITTSIVVKPDTTKDTSTNTNNNDLSIFDRTVYIWYSETDIKKVQEIYQKIWIYKWIISWNYSDIIDTIINYQLSNNLIAAKNDTGAGRFGPKTREKTKSDYLEYLEDWTSDINYEVISDTKIETQKIERDTLMSREDIEKKEVEDFLKYYNIELNFVNEGWNIKKGTTETLKLKITDKKGKDFKWEMPWGMTFIVNTEMVTVFPEKLFYFTDWKRDISLSWISEWNTNLYIKIGTETIKTIPLKVYASWQTIYPETSKIISPSKITLWEKQTWVVLFKDKSWKNLINLPFWSTFNIKASGENKICIKDGDVKNLKKIYSTSSCSEDDYKNEFNFTYNDTVWWLLVFDYKATSKDLSFKITNTGINQLLSEKKLLVANPKWLDKTYAYTNEVIDMLEEWVATWINKWYFLENRWLSQREALTWIENALYKMKNEVYDTETKTTIQNSIAKVEKLLPFSSKTKNITRDEFLDLNYTYLVLEETNTWKIEYRDIDSDTSTKLSKIFDEKTTWKDQFGEKYFRPEATITRWEWAFFIAKTLEKVAKTYLTLK